MSNNFLNALLKDEFYYHPVFQVKFRDYSLYNNVLRLTNLDDSFLRIEKLSETFFKIETDVKIKSEYLALNLNDFLILHRECKTHYEKYNGGQAAIVFATRKKNIFEFSKAVVFSFYDTCLNCDRIITYLRVTSL